MIVFKKISVFIAVLAMSITLFSFKSTNSNERNLGNSQVVHHTSFGINNAPPKPEKPKYTAYLTAIAWYVTGHVADYLLETAIVFTPEAPRREHDTQYQIDNL